MGPAADQPVVLAGKAKKSVRALLLTFLIGSLGNSGLTMNVYASNI